MNILRIAQGPLALEETESVLFPALTQAIVYFCLYLLVVCWKTKSGWEIPQFSKLQPGREVSLVVDTGSEMRWVYRDGQEIKLGIKRHLYKGDVILTTIDKFLYRYFAFGDKQIFHFLSESTERKL